MGGGARRRRTLKYHYSGRYLAHSIGWKRGPLGPHVLAQTRYASGEGRPSAPSLPPAPAASLPPGGEARRGLAGGGSPGDPPPPRLCRVDPG